MKNQLCVDLRYGSNGNASLAFEFNPSVPDPSFWDLKFEDGDLFVDATTGRRFTLRFEEVKCVDC